MNNTYKHIVLISLDTLRRDCITHAWKSEFVREYGSPNFNTTSLNTIIQKWTFFNNCITAAPYTTASHGAYFTWVWSIKNNVYEFFNKKINKETIFEHFKNFWYDTYFHTDFEVILWPYLWLNNGANHFYVEDEDAMLDKLLNNKSQPSLSFFHFWGIHYPYWFHKIKFAGNDYQEKVVELEEKYHLEAIMTKDMLDESFRDEEDMNLLLRYKNIIEHLYLNKMYWELSQLYLEWIEYFMEHRFNPFLERLLKFIDETNGLLVIFSDHGEDWKDDSKWHSNSISDKVLKVPMIFYGKGVPKWLIKNELVRTVDLFPTILQLNGMKPKKGLDWKSLNLLWDNKWRESFTQVWRVWNKEKVMRHQQKILSTNSYVRPLKTTLEKEMCYFDDFALSREYLNWWNVERLYKNLIDSIEQIPRRGNEETVNLLGSRLDMYSKKMKDNEKENAKDGNIESKIKAELSWMGYNV